MSKAGRPRQTATGSTNPNNRSRLDTMKDGLEYSSIVGMDSSRDPLLELRRALKDLEDIRGRPCLCYIANIIRTDVQNVPINVGDDLLFHEMVDDAPKDATEVDVFLVTPGGVAEQVAHFVEALRSRFAHVEFILPHMCMSAGTLFVLSGDRIWMDSRAYIGPIDPQVIVSGNYLPAQSVLALLKHIDKEGKEAMARGESIDWTWAYLLNNLDGRILGDALTQSGYAIQMASDYLAQYKFRSWTTHKSTGDPVTEGEKRQSAQSIAELLCSNERWKSHSHGISRDVANSELKLVIDPLENQDGLERATRRLWALLHSFLDSALVGPGQRPIGKLFLSQTYHMFRIDPPPRS